MGNNLSGNQSNTNLNFCDICKKNVGSTSYSYLDMECSKCNIRTKSYFHSDCLHQYRSEHCNPEFQCTECSDLNSIYV